MPEPPRPAWLDRRALAAHISVDVHQIRAMLRRGLLPAPSMHLGPRSPRWSVAAVDAALAGGNAAPAGIDAAVEAAAHAIAQGRQGRSPHASLRRGPGIPLSARATG